MTNEATSNRFSDYGDRITVTVEGSRPFGSDILSPTRRHFLSFFEYWRSINRF
jgi:hypothetical protein